MEIPVPISAILFFGVLLVAALGIYQNLLRTVMSAGGKVRTAELQLADLLVTLVLTGIFAALIARTVLRQDAPPTALRPDQVLPSASFFVILLVGVAGFLSYRGIDLRRQFGADRLTAPRAIAVALGLVIAAVPLVLAASFASQQFLPRGGGEQEMVTLFRDVVRNADHATVAKILVAGLIVAPVAEEFLFRGYFYPVLKRYLGPVASALFTAALFASFHLNLASLAGLFVLALCFTLAYEATGSLVVPVCMHAMFNFSQLAYLYADAHTSIPVP